MRKLPPCVAFLLAFAGALSANPQGASVAFGTVAVSTAGKTLTIDQTTDRAIINWQRFENTATETIRFNQPSLTSVTLNRVVGVDPSVISGALQSNGQLFLINPNGIVFDSTSRINVGGLVASTLSITDDDFKNGRYVLLQDPGLELSSVINRGQITAQPGQTVALLAPIVDNSGKIVATAGRVIITADGFAAVDTPVVPPRSAAASGKAVRMATVGLTPLLEDVVNTQSVATANRILRLTDGTVFLRGAGGLAVNGGEINVDGSAANPTGGRVEITGHRSVAFGPGSLITAKGFGASAATGDVVIANRTGNILTSRAGGAAPAHAIVQAGGTIQIDTFNDLKSDVGGGLDLRGGSVRVTGMRVGSATAPVTFGAGSRVDVRAGIDADLAFDGDVTADFLFVAGRLTVTSSGNVLAGSGIGSSPVAVDPGLILIPPPGFPPPPPPVTVAHVVASNINISATGDIGAAATPLSVGIIFAGSKSLVSDTLNVFTVEPNIVAFFLPSAIATAALVDDLPVARASFSPPVDLPVPDAPVVVAAAGPSPVFQSPVAQDAVVTRVADGSSSSADSTIGARDNVLLPALRGTQVRNQDPAAGDAGGLIEVVHSTTPTGDGLEVGASTESDENNRYAKKR